MRFSTQQHQFYYGIDFHARTMHLCILNQNGEILVHRNMPAGPEPFRKTIAPYRTDLIVCVEGLLTWDLAGRPVCPRRDAVCPRAGFVYESHPRGPGHKRQDRRPEEIAVLRRGGMLPQAYVYPIDMRATRDLFRRRMHLMRQRAELLGHIHNTNSQYNLPEIGKTIAD
jgi:hypothetical protein